MANRWVSRVVVGCIGAAACTSVVVGVAGVSGAATARPAVIPTANVKIVNYVFKPRALTIVVDTKVTWTNQDSSGHNVVFKRFSSPVLATGETYSHTFRRVGTFRYHCSLHFGMNGKVVVTAP